MAKREYTGDPIDLTQLPKETHLSEKNGETVAGTTEDDSQDERTEVWPSALDKDDFSPSEQEAIQRLCLHPNATYSAVAESIGCSNTIIYNARKKIAEMGLEDGVPFEVSRKGKQKKTSRGRNLSANEWFIKAMAENPEKGATEIASLSPDGKGWSVQNYYNVMREGRGAAKLKRRLIENGNWERATETIKERLEDIDVGVDPDVESEKQQDNIEENAEPERVEELEQTVLVLTKKVVAKESDCGFTESLLDEIGSSEVTSAVMEVVQDE